MIQFDEFGAIADQQLTPADLIGRRVTFRYNVWDNTYTTGTIGEHLGGMRFGILVDDYHTVDMHRSEFALPRRK